MSNSIIESSNNEDNSTLNLDNPSFFEQEYFRGLSRKLDKLESEIQKTNEAINKLKDEQRKDYKGVVVWLFATIAATILNIIWTHINFIYQ